MTYPNFPIRYTSTSEVSETFNPPSETLQIPKEKPVSSPMSVPTRVALARSGFSGFSLAPQNPTASWGSPLGFTPLAFFATTGCADQSLPGITDAETRDISSPDAGFVDAGIQDVGFPPAPDAGFDNPALTLMEQGAVTTFSCGTGATLPDIDEETVACLDPSGQRSNIFRWDPFAPGFSEEIMPIPLRFPPYQVEKLTGPDGNPDYVISEQGGTKTVVFDVQGGGGVLYNQIFQPINFAGTTAKGQSLSSIIPNSPQGLAFRNGEPFIATANYLPESDDFQPGTVLLSRGNAILTEGFNPTSLAVQGDRCFVVSSGARENNTPSTESFLEIYQTDAPHDRIKSIPLGKVAAGGTPSLALSPDGRQAVIPAGIQKDQVLLVDIENAQVKTLSLPTPNGEIATIQVRESGQHAFVVDAKNGQIHLLDLWNGIFLGNSISINTSSAKPLKISDGFALSKTLYLGIDNAIHRFKFE